MASLRADGESGGAERTTADREIWKVFTPATVIASNCQARTWSSGRGGQCSKKPSSANSLCDLHEKQFASAKGLTHGFVTGPIPEAKLEEFQVFALQCVDRPERKRKKDESAASKDQEGECAETQGKQNTDASAGPEGKRKKAGSKDQEGDSEKPRVRMRKKGAVKISGKKEDKGKEPATKNRQAVPPAPRHGDQGSRPSSSAAVSSHACQEVPAVQPSGSSGSSSSAGLSAGSRPRRPPSSSDSSDASESSSSSDDEGFEAPPCPSTANAIVKELLGLTSGHATARLALLKVALHDRRPEQLAAYMAAGVLKALKPCLEDAVKLESGDKAGHEQVALAVLEMLTCLPVSMPQLLGFGPAIKALRCDFPSTRVAIQRLRDHLRGSAREKGSGPRQAEAAEVPDAAVASWTDALETTESDLAEVEAISRAALEPAELDAGPEEHVEAESSTASSVQLLVSQAEASRAVSAQPLISRDSVCDKQSSGAQPLAPQEQSSASVCEARSSAAAAHSLAGMGPTEYGNRGLRDVDRQLRRQEMQRPRRIHCNESKTSALPDTDQQAEATIKALLQLGELLEMEPTDQATKQT